MLILKTTLLTLVEKKSHMLLTAKLLSGTSKSVLAALLLVQSGTWYIAV